MQTLRVVVMAVLIGSIVTQQSTLAKDSLREKVTPAVVFLHGNGIATTPRDGKIYEIWLKLSGTTKAIPQPQKVAGTGFLVAHKEQPLFFLVTAEHVARRLTGSCFVTMRADADRPFTLTLAQLAGTTNRLSWVSHGRADVAVLSLYPDRDTFRKHLKKHFMPTTILSSSGKTPARDIVLTALGFPLTLGVKGKFSPISRTSKPASGLLVLPRFDTKVPTEFFLLEDTSIGGFSGGPLFDTGGARFAADGSMTVRPARLKCVGLIHGSVGDRSGRMTAVVPSRYIMETITKAQRALTPGKEK